MHINSKCQFNLKGIKLWHINLNKWLMSVKPLGTDLGNQLSQNQPIEIWAQQAGMDWRIESSNVSYMAQNERGQSIIHAV